MRLFNEKTDAINLFESKICGLIFSPDGTRLTIMIDWSESDEKVTFVGEYCFNCQSSICSLDNNLCAGLLITGFSYKPIQRGYIVQFNFDLEVRGYLRFECNEFYIETEGLPSQPGGNDNLIE